MNRRWRSSIGTLLLACGLAVGCGSDDDDGGANPADPSSLGDPCTGNLDKRDDDSTPYISMTDVRGCTSGLCFFFPREDEGSCICDCKAGCECTEGYSCVDYGGGEVAFCLNEDQIRGTR